MLWNILKDGMLRHPCRTVTEGHASMTYEEIVVLVEELASRLTAPCYAVLCHTELFAGIAVLACFAAGVTAVPLSYRYGEAHLRRLTSFIHPPCILSDRGGRLEIVDTDTGQYEDPVSRPAVILCTSGTTGTPKGVMLSESNLLSNVRDIAAYFAVGEEDRLLIARPLYHSAVLTGEWLLALYKGLPVHFCSEAFHPAGLLQQIREYRIGVMGGTPTLLSLLGRAVRDPDTIASLHTLVVSGECLSPLAAGGLRSLFPGRRVYHVYGLTEASPRVAYLPSEDFDRCGFLVGRPLDSVTLKIVDGQGREVPAGRDGELLVQGPNVMMGYYKAPRQTRKALHGGWLHTGDVACKTSQGFYRIRGRIDDMIIRAGMNLYPAEIEETLRQDSRVREAMAYGFQGAGETVQIGLKIAGAFRDIREVQQLCRRVLPAYEVPTRVELLNTLPRNGSGKILRR